MSPLKILKYFLFFAMIAIPGACSKDNEPESRPFLMGFTPFPHALSADAMEYLYDKLSIESDIVNHHFDNGVPWVEALSGNEFPQDIIDDWTFRKGKIKAPHKTYISVTPINHLHTGLAAYRGSHENMALPQPWDSYTFDHDNVKNAYLNYCKRAIDFFKPDYFAMSIEANLLYKFRPEMWSQYLELHDYVYRRLKGDYPSLPIFTSLAGSLLMKDFIENNDHVLQRLAAMQLLEMSDYYAISFYPPITAYQDTPWPENAFDELFSLSTKPVIIAQTAFTAESFSVHTDRGFFMLATDPVKQKIFVDLLLAASEKWKAEFVIWFTLRDFEPSASSGSDTVFDIAWKDAGLYDENGNPRPAMNSWREWFRRKVEE